MTAYRVEGCLGVTVGRVSTVQDATNVVLKQIPISPKTVKLLAGRLERARVGARVHVDYGGTGCTVYVEEE